MTDLLAVERFFGKAQGKALKDLSGQGKQPRRPGMRGGAFPEAGRVTSAGIP
jgi:hypothetical protein